VRIPAQAIARGQVRALEIGGEDFVLWRGADGRVRSAPRWCPHLDHDLADGYVVECELVCAGHGWGFDGDGHAFKRNEWGRVDPKGTVPGLVLAEHDDDIDIQLPHPPVPA